MEDKRLMVIMFTVACLLLIPLVAMQFTEEVKWDVTDFIVAGGLLFGTGLLCEFVMRKVNKTKHRIIFCGIILAVLFLIWVELAVGIFGSPFAGS